MTIRFNDGIVGIGLPALGSGAMAATECVHSKWGEEDTLGSANLISPENTLKAAG